MGHSRSEWGSVAQGVPQGSILGPLIFNIFINDIFYALKKVCNLYNYADDNTLFCMEVLVKMYMYIKASVTAQVKK